ncbi:hypothetical protein F66182_3823 [Fusarium sp. NRRL 66182]|nr:hypothetical protein F66182_3823 [Fusarium sp. NRRL 66182]
MTPKLPRPRDASIETAVDIDLLAGLWQEAPFARLPSDAPPELKSYIQVIESPTRVYAIYQASRRHGFQLLVERFIAQLRYGCENINCATPTCFTCRRRLAGKAPIRRYNTTSARTLAIYLASQDDPENGLCPFIRKSQEPSATLGNLIFSTRSPSSSHPDHKRAGLVTPSGVRKERPSIKPRPRSSSLQCADLASTSPVARPAQSDCNHSAKYMPPSDNCIAGSDYHVVEGPISKDYRSFAANLFGTVTFKMLEWLTPKSMAAMSEKINDLEGTHPTASVAHSSISHGLPGTMKNATDSESYGASVRGSNTESRDSRVSANQIPEIDMTESSFTSKTTRTERGSISKTRNNATSKPRKRSNDPSIPGAAKDDNKSPKISQVNSFLRDKSSQPKSSKNMHGRGIPEVPLKPGFYENVTKPSIQPLLTSGQSPTSPEASEESKAKTELRSRHSRKACHLQGSSNSDEVFMLGPPHSLHSALPQALSRLDVDLIDFICDVYEEDGTFEAPFISANPMGQSYPRPVTKRKALNRRSASSTARSRKQWKSFNDQTLFNVLTDPQAVVQSFTCEQKLYDSQTLWYCFHRLSRVASTLVFHSLWLAAGRLFIPPQDPNTTQSTKGLNGDTHHRFADASENTKCDILQPLVDQLDFLSTGSASILEFAPSERLLHETRVPTVLLDWARTVLLNEWDGRADFAMDGSFGGALSFVETLHANKDLLLLGDIQFRVDYISERLDSIEMPVDWLDFISTRWKRHILDYPYIFSPDTLVSFFRSINFARMSRMFEESSSLKTRMSAIVDPGSLITNPHHKMVLQDLLRTASSKYLVLEIGRENVARDAFDQLWRREKRELLRPLKVHLGENTGEEGFDSGGVQQEFFRLAIAECLDPGYGAFTVDERTRMAWFAPGSLTEEWKFELVGLLLSLALYNGLTLPITFPKALYRKLLGMPVEELHHIADGWPDLANGLTTLLEWDEKDGLVEDIFARTYEFSVSTVGTIITREMRMDDSVVWPKAASNLQDVAPPHMDNPDDAPLVTNDNRDDYIIDYIRYLTDVSIRRQYLAFERGFNACLHKKSLSLLNPSTLQSLVEGIQEIDIAELRRYVRYVGWDSSHRTIKDFWSIVKRYDERMKQRLLEFVTSSDRVPVGGMKNLQFVIQKNGEEDGDSGHLPTAYTCYGTLLLPEYRDKEVLRERLGMALENAQGFGFA